MALPTDWQDRIQKQEGITTLALGPQAYVETRDPRYVSDAYQYFLNQGMGGGGPDAATMPATTVAQAPVVTTGDGGITAASAAQNMGGAGGAQNPLTQMITDPTTGQTMTVKQAMTQDAAYSLPGQSDPFLASGAAGGARLPATQYTTTLPSGDVLATDDPMLQEKMDYTQDPEAQNAWDLVKTGAQNVGDFISKYGKAAAEQFNKLTGGTIDLGKALVGGAVGMVNPALGLLTKGVQPMNLQQQAVADQFVDEGVILDDLGRIQRQEGLAYDTPENVMAGYVPGPTGVNILGQDIGGGIIQESIVDRLSTLEKTKNEKYGGSFYNEDGTPKINPATGKPTTLGAREEALKENLNMVARASGAVTLDDYDPIGKKAGETTYATDYFPELGQEDAPIDFPPSKKPDVVEDKIKAVDTIAGNTVFVNTETGEVFPDEVLAQESLSPTPARTKSTVAGPMDYLQPDYELEQMAEDSDVMSRIDKDIAPKTIDGVEIKGRTDTGNIKDFLGQEAPVTGVEGPPGIINPYQEPFGSPVDIEQGFTGEDPIMDMVDSDTAVQEAKKGEPVFDERLGWIDSVTEEPVDDPTIDTSLAGSITGTTALVTKSKEQLSKIEALENSDAYEFLTQEQKDQLKKEKEKIQQELKITPTIQPISLATVDTGDDADTDFDIDSVPVTTAKGPPSIISRPDPAPSKPDPAPVTTAKGPPSVISRPTPTFEPRGGGADRDPAPSRAPVSTAGQAGPPSQRGGGGGGGGGGGCFLKGTLVTMADGSTKAIEQVNLGDNVAKGGKVFATGKFLVENLHDYKGIKVSGSHMVNEDGNWVRVEDSKHGKPLGDDEHTVYVFGAENRRILINDILFTDYFEVKEQEKLSEGDKFFDNWKLHAKVDSDNNVNVLNAS